MEFSSTSVRRTTGIGLSVLLAPLLLVPAGCGGQAAPPSPAQVFTPTLLFGCNWRQLVEQCGQPAEVTAGWGQLEAHSVPAGNEARETQTFRLGVEGSPEGMAQMMRNFRAELEKMARAANVTITDSADEDQGSKTRAFRIEYASGSTRGRVHVTLERGKRFDRDENSQGKVEPWGGWSALLTVTQQESPE
jgi:hypothetical protein